MKDENIKKDKKEKKKHNPIVGAIFCIILSAIVMVGCFFIMLYGCAYYSKRDIGKGQRLFGYMLLFIAVGFVYFIKGISSLIMEIRGKKNPTGDEEVETNNDQESNLKTQDSTKEGDQKISKCNYSDTETTSNEDEKTAKPKEEG